MTVEYEIFVNRDDDDTLIAGTADDISADVLKLEWRTGMAELYQAVAPPSEATITVRNRDKAHSPELTTLRPGQRVEIRSSDGTSRTHYKGIVHAVEVDGGTQGAQQAVIHAKGIMHQLTQQSVRITPRVTASASTVLEDIFRQARFRQAALDGYCVLNRDGHNLIDSTTIAGDARPSRWIQPGKTTFTYAGDIWRDDVPITTAIRHLVEAEGGRFYATGDGMLVFFERHHLTTKVQRGTFSDNMDGLQYAYGDTIVNHVDVELLPRHIGQPNSLLWKLDEPFKVFKSDSVQVVATYTDSTGLPVGAVEVLPLKPYTHYTATWLTDPPRFDVTDSVRIRFLEVGATVAVIEVVNSTGMGFHVQEMELRGTPVSIGQPYTIAQQDSLSITDYGMRRLSLSVPVLSSDEEAAALARTVLVQRSRARGQVRSMTLTTQHFPSEVLTYHLFDRIGVEDSQTGHTDNYSIIGQKHVVDRGGSRHRVTWLLEPSPAGKYVILDSSDIDSDDVLLPR